jgi:hypothetical protein
MTEIDFATATPEQLAGVEPAEFIRAIKGMSDQDLAALMASPNRAAILASVFERMPQIFRADRAGSMRATTHWSVTGGPDGGADDWTVRVADGTCTTTRGHDGDATLALTMGAAEFLKLISKSGNPVMMFMTGKMKARGDLGLAANLANVFDVPKP